MWHRILIYGLPVYLYALEVFLKTVTGAQGESVAGPSLASAGIAFLLPLTRLKAIRLDPALAKTLQKLKVTVHSERDAQFRDFVLVLFFLSLGGWMESINLTRHSRVLRAPYGGQINLSLLIGCSIFVISIICSEIKERI